MTVIYGFDALCGWCYGFVPAMRALRDALPDVPVTLAMPGLVTGDRVGPYAEMEGYIRGAALRLQSVTGRAPSPAFYDLIRQGGVRGDSGPPTAAIAQVSDAHPARTIDFAHAVIEAHFQDGADLNAPATYARVASAMGLDDVAFDLHDTARVARAQAEGRRHGIASFPTLIVDGSRGRTVLPSVYDPGAVVRLVRDAL